MENQQSISTANVLINASKEEVWDLLFNRFGETHLYNPNIVGSHDVNDKQGQIGCERQCSLNKRAFIKERIIEADQYKSIVIDTIGGNMPMVNKMRIKLKLEELSPALNKINIEAVYTTKPAFMALFVKGMFKKMLFGVLVGLKYYLETGAPVSKGKYNMIYRKFKSLQQDQPFASRM